MAKHRYRNLVRNNAAYNWLLSTWRDLRFGRQLSRRQMRLKPEDRCILFSCIRNEMPRMDFFHRYYRDLGVDHFVFVDNGSTDGLAEWAKDKPDVSVWHTESSYKASGFGVYWCNYLLKRFGSGRLCITVDPDEMLVYPHMETRSLKDLGQFLRENGQAAMGAIMLDAYSDKPLGETVLLPGASPFELCPYFDRNGYVQKTNYMSGTFIQGGPRLRALNGSTPKEAPALNKIPVVWWKSHYRYQSSAHSMWPWTLNRMTGKGGISLSGGLFHFKFVAALSEKVEDELKRQQHYGGSREYKRYHENLEKSFFREGLSLRYENSAQLVALGLMNEGEWV